MSYKTSVILLFSGTLIATLLSLFVGEHLITPAALWRDHVSVERLILLQLRLPHTLNAIAIGGILGLSGCLMQALLANPLADPYILGSSSGAAVFTLLGLLIGLNNSELMACSLLGVLLAMWLLHWSVGGIHQTSSAKLLLMGVMLAAGWAAILSLLLLIAPAGQTKSMLFWLFGDIDCHCYPILALSTLVVGGLIAYRLTDELNILSQGHLLAQTLGVDTQSLQLIIFMLTAALIAIAVSLAGTIGFVGLVVPHCARLLLKTHSKLLIPTCIFLGSLLLILADLISRTILPSTPLPIGLFTTLLGIPLFLYLVRNNNG
jgi:iron complex transport system permease protein